ncbi:MAG TPA: CorA family divalent cation transporter [Gallionella sp.]|nr:CorA family divalent cation transporter [Gallionella sp.]
MSNDQITEQQTSQQTVLNLIKKHRLVEDFVHKQDMPRQDLVESLVRKQNLAKLQQILNQISTRDVAQILEQLSADDQLFVWDQINDDRKELILQDVPITVLQALGKRAYKNEKSSIKAFELYEGRLREIVIGTRDDLIKVKPVWVDMVNPSFEERLWVGAIFDIELPDPDKLNDLESSARFYVDDNGAINLRSDFLLDKEDVSRSVPVAFSLHQDILFSLRKVDLPVFRLQRLRALTQPNYVLDSRDVLLDLYAADAEYSADALEDVYQGLRVVSKQVLSNNKIGEQADDTLTAIAHEEDLNGLIRRNVLDTRRAVSFLMRSKFLNRQQLEDAQQILRDIDSLDGHTSFIFDKINFLMDATVGFINNNQNKNVKRLTVLSVVFMPLNVLAGIGGMSEFSMMTQGIPWPVSYGLFTVALVGVAWLTYLLLRFFENREKPKSVVVPEME